MTPETHNITEFNDGELFGKAIAELHKQGIPIAYTHGEGYTTAGELEKIGITTKILSDTWGIDKWIIEQFAQTQKPPQDWNDDKMMRELHLPLERITIEAVHFAHDPGICARMCILRLTDCYSRKVSDSQITHEGIARLGGVSVDEIERFMGGEECLSDAVVTRLCIALLIIDRELNYSARRDYFWNAEAPVTQMGEIIKILRHRHGLTQEQLAEMLNVTDRAVSKWESGSGMPDIAQLAPIADVFGVTIDVLFGRMPLT